MTAVDPNLAHADPEQKIFSVGVGTLAAADAITVDARGAATLTVIAGAGCTVTVSRVDTLTANAVTTIGDYTVTASTINQLPVDWPFYYISAAGGAARFSLV